MTTEGDLTIEEARRRVELEQVIEAGKRSFVAMGKALTEIRDQRLYRGEYTTFEDYCRDRWGFGRSYAYELINAARVTDAVSGVPDMPAPRSAAVARELGSFGDDLEAMRETWQQAVDEHGEPTGAQVRDIRERRKAPAPPVLVEPKGDPEKDFRFQVVEDVVELLEQVSDPESVVLPTDPGDVEAFDEAVRFLAAWTPRMTRVWREHKRALRRRAA